MNTVLEPDLYIMWNMEHDWHDLVTFNNNIWPSALKQISAEVDLYAQTEVKWSLTWSSHDLEDVSEQGNSDYSPSHVDNSEPASETFILKAFVTPRMQKATPPSYSSFNDTGKRIAACVCVSGLNQEVTKEANIRGQERWRCNFCSAEIQQNRDKCGKHVQNFKFSYHCYESTDWQLMSS